jgi:signal recognition particle receptor subunit beta
MNDFKIIFSGPVGAGKTTAINAISDIETVSTDELASDMTQAQIPGTTVAMDYGMLKLGEGERIHLYGTPEQERFNFMWDILTQGGIGLILLLNNSRPDPFGDMQFFLDTFKGFINGTKLVIGVTQMDLNARPTIDDYHLQLENSGHKIPVFEVDARQKRDVTLLVEALLYTIDPGLDG